MNTRIASIATLAVLVVGSVTPAVASSPSPSPLPRPRPTPFGRGIKELRKEFHLEVKDTRENFKDEVASRSHAFKEEIKARLSEFHKNRIKKWWTNAQRRLQRLIDREKKVADKIQARIDRAAANGKNVTAATTALADAKTAIDTAQTALADASGQIDGIIANNTPADAFSKLHDLLKGVVEKIRDARQKLVHAIVVLGGIGRIPSPSPSPSASPSPTPTVS